jgi:hypothetical protein
MISPLTPRSPRKTNVRDASRLIRAAEYFPPSRLSRVSWLLAPLLLFLHATPLPAQDVSLQSIVTPSTVVMKDGRPVTFAIHAFIEFKSLSAAFSYIDAQTRRWKPDQLSAGARAQYGRELLHEAVESRIVSMTDERPFEMLVTHTADELRQAIARVREPVPAGYADAFLQVQEKWKHSLNCWSASPLIPGRVLSNWYPIEEGIELHGATYDTTEHFWQAVKYHPDVTVGELRELLSAFEKRNWQPWLRRLDDDPKLYLPNAYALEFLRHNLTSDRLQWFDAELTHQGLLASDHARQVQQRHAPTPRFTGYEEKVLWGDLADVLHLVYWLSPDGDPMRQMLVDHHFDAIYLGDRRMGFISPEFRSLMLEIWRVKYLQMPRFREVIADIPLEIKLEHFLNDGDSPDIPIPTYVQYLNQIRELALRKVAPEKAR